MSSMGISWMRPMGRVHHAVRGDGPVVGELDDLDGEVVAAEAVDEEGWLRELELGDDVLLDGGRGGGGEGDSGDAGEHVGDASEFTILRAELVAPGRDAVGFVDGEQRQGKTRQAVHRAVRQQAFR